MEAGPRDDVGQEAFVRGVVLLRVEVEPRCHGEVEQAFAVAV